MTKLILTDHARERMFLRRISKRHIQAALEKPDDTVREDDGDTRHIKAVKRGNNQHRDLHVVAKPMPHRGKDTWLIKTVWIRGEDDPEGLTKILKTLWIRLFFRKSDQN